MQGPPTMQPAGKLLSTLDESINVKLAVALCVERRSEVAFKAPS